MSLHESGEMYLETILVLSHTLEHVRSVDVADHMNFSKPSVSRGMKLLREQGYISVDGAGYLTLTDSGRDVKPLATGMLEAMSLLKNLEASEGVTSGDTPTPLVEILKKAD